MGIFGESLPLFGAVNLDFEFHSVSNSIIYDNGRFACIARAHRQRARPSFALMVSSVIVIKLRTVFKPGPGLTAHRLCFPAVIPVPPMRPAACRRHRNDAERGWCGRQDGLTTGRFGARFIGPRQRSWA